MSFEIKSSLKWDGLTAIKDFDNANFKGLTESAILVEGRSAGTVHVDSGDLKRSIGRNIRKETAYVGTTIEYAPYEEFGTRFRPAHPYLRPAFFKSIKEINNIFKKLYKAVKYVD